MMKYVVVCYAVHDMTVASCDAFEMEEAALSFMEDDAWKTYEESVENDPSAEFENYGDSIYVSASDKEAEWTWHICPINAN